MQLLRETPLQVAYLPWVVPGHPPSVTVVVKGTFDLRHGEVARLAASQALPTPETFNDVDADQPSVRYDSDFAFRKARAECFVAGTAHAPKGRPVQALTIGFQIGPISRRMAVIGDRQWKRGLLGHSPTDPAPFTQMPLSLERAFGGPGFAPNPIGVGIAAGEDGWRLPNLELADQLIDSVKSRPTPASWFPVPRTFEARVALAGQFDEAWAEKHWPHLPPDFDFAYFSAAPEGQQHQAWFQSDEEIILENLHPEHPRFVSRLPGATPKCLFQSTGEPIELPLVLDTITVDADLLQAFCVWRGILQADSVEGARLLVADTDASLPEMVTRLAKVDVTAEQDEIIEADPVPEDPDLAEVDTPTADLPEMTREAFLETVGRGEPLSGEDLSGVDLSELDLAGINLSDAILDGADFARTNLKNANLSGAVLTGARLDGAHLSGANLSGADLTGANGAGVDFSTADLSGAVLDDAKFPDGRFSGARCGSAEMIGTDLSRADFAQADLTEADLSRALLTDANLQATLVQTTIEGVQASGADLGGMDVEGLKAGGADLRGANLAGVQGTATRFQKLQAEGADFSGATLPMADFTGSKLAQARFSGCELRGARLVAIQAEGATFDGANLFGASFESADLTGANLTGANCFGAEMWKVNVTDARLDGTNLQRTRLAKGSS